jgi:hypothetical protein
VNYFAHKRQHLEWHVALDQLIADYVAHHGWLPQSITELQAWSHQRTKDPSDLPVRSGR